ncbi:MAG: SDR family oxidoreductase [Thermoanaerobaculia bacterium]
MSHASRITRPALISGAGSGIGRAVAVELGRRGHPLVLLGRREEPLRATLAEAGDNGRVVAVDVRDAGIVDALVESLPQALSPAIVVPAAGVARVAPFVDLTDGQWRESLDTNLLGSLHLYRAFLRRRAADGGHLFAILSIAARRGFPDWSAYAASKWALRGAFECLREELRGQPVRLTSIYAGATSSPLWDDVGGTWDHEAMIAPEEIARSVGWALDSAAAVEEVVLRPPGGDL